MKIQKLIPKGEIWLVRYPTKDNQKIGWIITRKVDGTYVMYKIQNNKLIKCGRKRNVYNPKDLENYVEWIN